MPDSFSLSARAKSFRYAARGVVHVLHSQHNAWIHVAIAVAVVALALALDLGRLEWGLLVLAIAAVLAAESLNTAIERLADAVLPEHHPLVENAKDAAAGGVLITAIGAAAVGLLVLGPPLLRALGWLPLGR